MKTRVRELKEHGDRLFSLRFPLLTLWQQFAEQFYPMRADFTRKRFISEEFASYLMTGRPVMAHRDLGNALSSMLRPRGQPWFHARTDSETINNDPAARAWLDRGSDILRRIMYDGKSQFIRATKEGDNDFVAFGQCVISVEPNRDLDGILYRDWHLRDTVWTEDANLVIDQVHREWKLEARQLVKLFPKTAHASVTKAAQDEPFREIKCRHIVVPGDEYDLGEARKGRRRHPFVSIYIDADNDTILEEAPRRSLGYVIPRWVTVSGSQYAYSPATVVALPDARMLQQIGLTLLEAGQKVVDPPMVAVGEAINGGVNLYAGGITWVDSDYDERTGEVLRPLTLRPEGLQWGDARETKIEQAIADAFYLNQITLPDVSGEMTAYEVQKRIEEYIRKALPLFEPMEVEYNGGLCDASFDLALRMGAFGSVYDMPAVLRGQNVRFQFESPLQAASDRSKAQAFVQASQLLAAAMQIDPNARFDLDVEKAFRDAVLGAGAPADWVVPEDQAAQAKEQAAQAAQAQQAAATLGHGAEVAGKVGAAAKNVGDAATSLQQAGIV